MVTAATRVFPSAMESMIVVASNRGPVSFDHDAAGALTSQRGAGGLVTALSGVFFRDETTWVAAAMTEGDREVAVEGYELDPESRQRVRFVLVPPERYDAYYNQMDSIGHDLGAVARHSKDAVDQRPDALANLARAEHGASAAQSHMLPRPRFVALILLEGIERNDEHSLGPSGSEPGVDIVERPRSRRDAQRGRHPAREAIEIIVGPERPSAVRNTVLRRVQIDDVEVRGMSERMAAEAPESEDHELAAGKLAVRLLERVGGGLTQRDQRAFGDAGIALGDLERVAAAVDQLDSERKTSFVDEPARAVQRDVVGLVAHRIG